jgi:Antirestriction protein
MTARLSTNSHLSFQGSGDSVSAHFHHLRKFALRHPEADAIRAAID